MRLQTCSCHMAACFRSLEDMRLFLCDALFDFFQKSY
jgi:hypothetical protein